MPAPPSLDPEIIHKRLDQIKAVTGQAGGGGARGGCECPDLHPHKCRCVEKIYLDLERMFNTDLFAGELILQQHQQH